MKMKKRSSSASGRFSRGAKISAKKSGVRRHAKKSTSRRSAPAKRAGFLQKLEDLTPL